MTAPTLSIPDLIATLWRMRSNILTALNEAQYIAALDEAIRRLEEPIPMRLYCPQCGAQHIDAPDEAIGWANAPHRSHLCAKCGHIWRPADVATTGVENLKGEG